MCTAATYKTNDFYFGRTLDYESSYGEEIVIMPRNFPLNFVNMGRIATHYAVIGTAHVAQIFCYPAHRGKTFSVFIRTVCKITVHSHSLVAQT